MAICYGWVAIGRRGIIAEYSEDDEQNFRAVVSSMLPNIATQNTMKIFMHQRYNFAVLPDNGVLYICTTTPDFPEKDSFMFLEELMQTFNSENNNLHFIEEESPDEADGLNVHNDDIESAPNVTVADGLGVKKVRKMSVVVKKKMKKFKKGGKKLTKSRKLHIPGFSKRKHTVDPSDQSSFTTPSSKNEYVSLRAKQDQGNAPVWTDQGSCPRQIVIKDTSPSAASTTSGHTIESLQEEVEEVQGIVKESIEKALTRGDKLDDLLVRAQDLEATAGQFQKTTKRLKRKMKWRNRRTTITAVTVAGVIVTVVVVLVVVLTV